MATTAATAYTPGVCNINPREVAYRRRVGYIAGAIFIVGFVVLLLVDIPRLVRVVLLVPAIVSISGFLQARHKFCVAYGGSGRQNADGDSMTTAQTVGDDSARQADKRRTSQINRQTMLLAVVVTAIAVIV